MCGIAGFVGEGTRDELERMLAAVRHRGPDDQGIEVRPGVGFVHARLSIVDTSSKGHQPMLVPQDNPEVMITYNGEVYNFEALRKELAAVGRTFVSHSDTEVILHLYQQYGEKCFEKMDGMFALAIYDFRNQRLLLARDRMGEKPLYWTNTAGTFLFASELKALFASARVPKELNLSAVSQYLLYDYVPTPQSIIKNVHKLEPGAVIIIEKGTVRTVSFWQPPQEQKIGEQEALSKLDSLLAQSVERQSVSDVPLGIFLSGGLDSSTVAYYASRGGVRPKTFSIGFDDPSFDESHYAREVSTWLKTDHHERQLKVEDALDLVSNLGDVLCEPLADASILPTLLLSKFAREQVTVALGGDGGDELFAGYPTFLAEAYYQRLLYLPLPIRRTLLELVESLPATHSSFAFSYNLRKLLSSEERDPVRRHMEWIGAFPATARGRLASDLLKKEEGNVFESVECFANEISGSSGNRLLFAYARSYLLDGVLVKVDRASMRHGLEVRAPLLDRALIDFVLSLPYELKCAGTTKYLLKKLMQDKLPPGIASRKKQGFGVPIAGWLAGPLRPLCEDLLSSSALRAHGLFNEVEVTRLMQEHFAKKRDNRKELWNLMIFQIWYNRWIR